ncbi:SDR family NAD(P)-dependent oxidoreductase, partial [Schaedlerella sp.]|uniref:SDR family NAD(P)-dependent oxidoreductase n=1 Tax=Schaedlerella sp. TaxID=2676057 RepID=UPI0037469252
TLDINLLGPFILSKILINYWIDMKKHGKIINIVSQAAFHGSTSGHAHYASSKAGLVGFTISLAREVAPYGINVTAVAPGIMRSPMNEEVLKDPKRVDAYLERIPLRRVSEPVDVARSVLFLASTQADYITGATIDVTGGMLMR